MNHRTCAVPGCDANLRSDNTSGYCKKHAGTYGRRTPTAPCTTEGCDNTRSKSGSRCWPCINNDRKPREDVPACNVVSYTGIPCDQPQKYANGWCGSCYIWSRNHGGKDPSGRKILQPVTEGITCNVVFTNGVRCTRKATRESGMCQNCNRRARNGVVEFAQKAGNGDVRKFLEQAASATTRECIDFPGGKGRKSVGLGGFNMNAARAVWILAHGDPDGMYVLHKCHRGDEGCINVRHLYLGTAKDNTADIRAIYEIGKAVVLARIASGGNGVAFGAESEI